MPSTQAMLSPTMTMYSSRGTPIQAPLDKCAGIALYRIAKGESANRCTPGSTFGRDKDGKQTHPSSVEVPIRKYN